MMSVLGLRSLVLPGAHRRCGLLLAPFARSRVSLSTLAATRTTPLLRVGIGGSGWSGITSTALLKPAHTHTHSHTQTQTQLRCFSGGSMQGTANDVNVWSPAANRSHWLFGRVGLAMTVLMFTGWSLYLLSTRGREQPTPPIAAALNTIYQVGACCVWIWRIVSVCILFEVWSVCVCVLVL
jgi:hypothetical protein